MAIVQSKTFRLHGLYAAESDISVLAEGAVIYSGSEFNIVHRYHSKVLRRDLGSFVIVRPRHEEELHKILKKACRPFTTVDTDSNDNRRPLLENIDVTILHGELQNIKVYKVFDKAKHIKKYAKLPEYGLFLTHCL